MPSFESLLKEKNDRLSAIPLTLQTTVEKQQSQVLNDILAKLSRLATINGQFKIEASNIRLVSEITDELKGVFLNADYLKAVTEFASEFEIQANLNSDLIQKGFKDVTNPVASELYIQQAKKNAIETLSDSRMLSTPVQKILENSVINGATINDTIDSLRNFVEGEGDAEGKILKYVKGISNDSFAIADRSYTSIVSESLGNDWFYYNGSEVDHTRCFCHKRVGNYYHYKEIESWGNGENLGECDLGDGTWAGEIQGTDSATIYSYLGGYGCLHSLIPVSEAVVPESDMERTRNLGYIE